MELYYNIAGLNVILDSYGRIIKQAEKYKCAPFERADINISSNAIKTMREYWRIIDRFSDETDDNIEYLATGAFFYKCLLDFDSFHLHSSAVVFNNKAYLFSAESGTGKSTHTSLWLKQFGDSAYILNDDKPVVRLENGVWYAYGSPWSGSKDISVNAKIPVAGVATLVRSKQNFIERISATESVDFLMTQVNRSRNPEYMNKLFNLFEKFISDVPIWKLYCNMDPEAAIVSYEAMSGEKFVPTTEM